MPIADLQRSLVELGRIRLGRKVRNKNGREMADRLDTLRFTSSAEHLILEVAANYGGEVKPWQNGKKAQFEVITEAAVIPVYVPPQIVDPWYESWAGGVCQRRCDGIRDVIHDRPCDCTPDDRGKRNCKPTTRVNLMLADIPGLGVWRLETHGIYAAGEMVQMSNMISGIQVPLPGRLILEKRDGKRFNRAENKVETLDYNVPVIHIDAVTSRHFALGGDAISQALRASGQQVDDIPAAPAVGAAEQAPALPAAPARTEPAAPAGPDPELIDRALAAIKTATANQMGGIRERIRLTGDPQVLIDAFQLRLGELAAEAAVKAPDPRIEQALEALRSAVTRAGLEVSAEAVRELFGGDTADIPEPVRTFYRQRFQGLAPGPDSDEAADERRQAAGTAPQTAPVAPPEPQEPPAPIGTPPATPEGPGDRQAALTRLLGIAGGKGIKRAQLDERMQAVHGVALKAASTVQLDDLVAML